MTDRYCVFIVVLEKELRSDDAEATIAAIKQIKGVASVEPQVANMGHYFARSMARTEILNEVYDLIRKKT
jgi:hypothetical protein